jgi:hypothetical protein
VAETKFLPLSLTGPTGEAPVQPVALGGRTSALLAKAGPVQPVRTGPTGGTLWQNFNLLARAPPVQPVRTGPTGGALGRAQRLVFQLHL